MKKKNTGNGITVSDDGRATVKCGKKEIAVRYEGEIEDGKK